MSKKVGKQVVIKRPGITETIFGKPRKIVIPQDHMLVEYRRPSTRQVWLRIVKKPDDGKFEDPELEKTIFLDGKLSDNGGDFVTVDADLGVQTGFQTGLVTVPVYEEEEVETANGDGTAMVETKKKAVKLDVVETREWVGLDGTATWINERDVSFKQIAQANMMDVLKRMENAMKILMIAVIVVSFALVISGFLNYQVADAAGLIDGVMPGK